MISLNELRIGNWVIQADKYIPREAIFVQVTNIYDYKINIEPSSGYEGSIDLDGIDYEEIQPIPLTSEIFEKCKGNHLHRLELLQGLHDGKFGLRLIDDDFVYFSFLHEYQNIYHAIFGEELQINL